MRARWPKRQNRATASGHTAIERRFLWNLRFFCFRIRAGLTTPAHPQDQ